MAREPTLREKILATAPGKVLWIRPEEARAIVLAVWTERPEGWLMVVDDLLDKGQTLFLGRWLKVIGRCE